MALGPDRDPNPLISLFRQCVVCITDEAGQFCGSGFFTAPGRVVTCGHVVHGAAALRLRWQDRTAAVSGVAAVPPLEQVADPGSYPLPDLAVLDVDDAAGWGHPCAALGAGQPVLGGSRDGLYLAGYTIEHGAVPALTGATTGFESLISEDGHTFYKLKRGQVLPGFSGAPLLDLRAGLVAGITESSRGRHADLGGFAVPAVEVAAAFPELAEASRAFQVEDKRWRTAAEAERARAAERAGGRGRLPLRPPFVPLAPDEDLSPAKVLRPRHAVVGYTGREQLLGELAGWCEREPDGGGPAGVWFVAGEGGFGKTRLAVEACREAEARGWTAGLLRPGAGPEGLRALAEWPGRLLIAVDYAEADPALIGQLAEEFAVSAPRPAVRIMLLVRRRASRAELLEWFNEQREEQLDALLRQAGISRLEDDASEVDRLQLFRQGAEDFGPFLGPAPPAMRVPRLRAAHFARPLYVLAAAWLARASGGPDVDALSEADLLRALLDQHEAAHWARLDRQRGLGLDPADQRAAVAVATLLTAEGDDEALAIARLVPHLGGDPESRLIAMARWLARLYPPPGGEGRRLVITPLEPDRLGEVLVGDVLAEHPGLLAAALDAASESQLARALTVAARVAREDQAVAAQLRDALDDRLPGLIQRGLDADGGDLLSAVASAMIISRPARGAADAAGRFPEALPVWLRPLAVMVTGLAADGLRTQASGAPYVLPRLASLLNNLANRLSDMGRREEALEAIREAVDHYRQLTKAGHAAFLPNLAASLGNLANCLGDVGRREEALETAREAVKRYRQLAKARPEDHLPDLAVSLGILSVRLGDVGRREEALETAREAVKRYRQLAETSPEAFLPDLAKSLDNLATCLGGMGRREEEALETAREAVTILRQLAETSPEALLPDLARSLNNLAVFLSSVGRREEALKTADEAVTIRRQLAETSPEAFLPDLAASLSNLAKFLREVERREEALETVREAVTILRQLAETSPEAFLPDLARSLNNLATFLSEAGSREEALKTADEAVAYYRELAKARPAAFLPDLARSLDNLAICLRDLRLRKKALEAADEAVTILRQLAETSPEAFLPDLARSLNNLANCLRDLRLRKKALEAADEAVTIRRQLAETSPEAFLPDLATSLNNLAVYLSEAERADRVEELFAGTLGSFPGSTRGIGHILFARGRWKADLARFADAIHDLTSAISAFGRDDDWGARGQARLALRALRENDPSAFDHAWSQANGPLPLWLDRLTDTQQLTDTIIAWIDTPDWQASRTYLDDNTDSLLTDQAEAAIEHLIDVNPAADELREHLELLQAARTHGINAAYAAHQEQLLTRHLAQTLDQWLATRSWTASRAFVTDHGDDLLHPTARAILDDLSSQDPADLVLRLHRGLLGYATTAGFDAAYDLLPGTSRQRAISANPATPDGTRLAIARIHSGQADDDPEAHFQLVTFTLLAIPSQATPQAVATLAREAAAALADCAANAAPYEQREFARRLTQLAAQHPPLASHIAELQHVLTGKPDASPS